mgnify:CR=1 FL=1|nr:sugar phosphate isomerase/epimerase family protein [uncultured Anaerosporobacter sp.]
MKVKLTGFADEIAQELTKQVESLKGLEMLYVEMRGVDGNNLIYHTDEKVKEIKKVLDDNDIRISALGSPLGKIGIADDFEPHFEDFKRAIEIGHMMECPNIRLFSFYLPKENNPTLYESAVIERIGRFVDYATANGAVLFHENEKGIYGEKAMECKKLMDVFYGEHFKVIFDFANFVQCQEDTLEAYKLLKNYIAYIHVKDVKKIDGSVVPAGYGDGNVAVILKDLFESGFDGFLSLEPHLFNFEGFTDLEKEGKSMLQAERKMLTGLEAFTLAYNSLEKILKGYKR